MDSDSCVFLNMPTDKIKDLLAPNAIGSLTKLVLVNAIYFKGNWERKFEAESTHDFVSCLQNETKPVQMMHQTDNMIIMLPDLKDDASGLEKVNCTNPYKMDNDEIVMLPKFKMENTYGFTSTLGGMRMVDVFDVSKANFLGMTEKNDLNLSKVVHKTFADVNEEGTEAAAATAVTMRLMCLMITMEFVADHPFLFFISHNKTHNILFFGRFSSP
uniref:Serpin B6 n=1 Tax=Callorhinchus milii TaxID=7868 RepID=A0A4W3KJ14_CALMI